MDSLPRTPKIIHLLCILVAVVTGATIAQARSAADLSRALSEGDRSEADKARDADRRPGEVAAFLGIEPGMTVVDLIAAGGYYTEVLSVAVGPQGRVFAQNNAYVLQLREGANEKAITARLSEGRLGNVERLDREVADLGLEPGSVDAALTALNFHDIANSRGPEATAGFLAAIMAILEPGGILGVIDHDGDAGNDNKSLHRIPRSDALKAVKEAGFELVAEGDMLRNPGDDHTRNVFAEGMRGKTDRFVLLLRKPQLAVEGKP